MKPDSHQFDRNIEDKRPNIGFVRESFFGLWWVKTFKVKGSVRCIALRLIKNNRNGVELDSFASTRIVLAVDLSGKSDYHQVRKCHELGLQNLRDLIETYPETNGEATENTYQAEVDATAIRKAQPSLHSDSPFTGEHVLGSSVDT